jgi:hypothetical protein
MITPTKIRRVSGIGGAAVIAALTFGATVLVPTAAEAFVAVGFSFPIGFPFFYPPYPYPYYYPPPPYYPPPAYPPPPVAYQPSTGYAPSATAPPAITYTPRRAWTDASGRQCREYKSTRDINGRATQVYGTACRDADGQWRLVN